MQRFPKLYDYEERLVRFAGESSFFVDDIVDSFTANYYKNQLIRSILILAVEVEVAFAVGF